MHSYTLHNSSFSEGAAEAHPPALEESWRPLQLLNYYRLTLALLLGSFLVFTKDSPYIGATVPKLALFTALGYLLFATVNAISIRLRLPNFLIQTHFHIIGDIIFINLLMHSSGGIESGLGMLINVVIAGGAIVAPGRIAHLFAAVATITIMLEQVYCHLAGTIVTNYTHAGFLGASYFATATMAYVLAKRIRDSEALATQRGMDLEDLSKLSEYIIQKLDSGIMVIDENMQVRQMNAMAEKMLGRTDNAAGRTLANLSSPLLGEYNSWLRDREYLSQPITLGESAIPVRPKFTRFDSGSRHHSTLIVLEDVSSMMQQAQQIKLASLGRLTASIAHEIRNPLGAISHAAQLLQESSDINFGDRRLMEIIQNHSVRVNVIIENILQLSRREKFLPESIRIKPWLENFVDELCRQYGLQTSEVMIDMDDPDLQVFFDPSQLHQILTNLSENALRYCEQNANNPQLRFISRYDPHHNEAILDVIDNGPGIPAQQIEHVFEPFFTTENTGTGLGLYICRELCDINKARITYMLNDQHESCFRIYFPKVTHG